MYQSPFKFPGQNENGMVSTLDSFGMAPSLPMSFGATMPSVPVSGIVPNPAMSGGMTSPMGTVSSPGLKAAGAASPNWFTSTFKNQDGGLNMGNIGSAMQGLGALGSLWGGIQANKLAKDSLNFQKDAYNTNLTSQRASYNMALEDRANSRYAQKNASQSDADAYISKHRLGD